MQVQPYLNFNGRCEEALDFYRRALGAEVTTLMRFKDSPDPAMVTPGTEQAMQLAVVLDSIERNTFAATVVKGRLRRADTPRPHRR